MLLLEETRFDADREQGAMPAEDLQSRLLAQSLVLPPDVMPQLATSAVRRLPDADGAPAGSSVSPEQASIARTRSLPQDTGDRTAEKARAQNNRKATPDASQADEAAQSQPADRNDAGGSSTQKVGQAQSAASSADASSASDQVQAGVEPADLVEIVESFEQQLQSMLASGDFSGLLSLLRSFVAQLQALSGTPQAAGGQPVAGISGQASAATVEAANSGAELWQQLVARLQLSLQQGGGDLQASQSGAAFAWPADNAQLAQLTQELQSVLAQWKQSSGNAFAAQASVSSNAPQLETMLAKLRTAVASVFHQQLADSAPNSAEMFVAAAPDKSLQDLPVPTAKTQETSPATASLSSLAAPAAAPESQPVQNTSATNSANQPQAGTATAANAISAGQAATGDLSGDGGEQNRQPQMQMSGVQQAASTTADSVASRSHTAPFARLLNPQPVRPVVEQVAFQIRTAMRDGGSQITIQLDPVELGKVDIKLHVASDGRTQVMVTVDNKETLALLQKDSAGLERALSDAGLKADSGSLNFNLRQGQHQQDADQRYARDHYLKTMPEEEEILPASVIVRSYKLSMTDGIDIKI
jgi:hypothetical protein